ncbi:hypothetical protein FHG87_018373 [Trinorchestia longiramus]|nr:hypothetical protein FHG87_018373 [Trinorchestia longiramus]
MDGLRITSLSWRPTSSTLISSLYCSCFSVLCVSGSEVQWKAVAVISALGCLWCAHLHAFAADGLLIVTPIATAVAAVAALLTLQPPVTARNGLLHFFLQVPEEHLSNEEFRSNGYLVLVAQNADKDVLVFEGNRTHTDHFKLMLYDGAGAMLIGGRNMIYNVSLHDFKVQNCYTKSCHPPTLFEQFRKRSLSPKSSSFSHLQHLLGCPSVRSPMSVPICCMDGLCNACDRGTGGSPLLMSH